MNFLMNLVAALWVGFSVVAGERPFGAAIALLWMFPPVLVIVLWSASVAPLVASSVPVLVTPPAPALRSSVAPDVFASIVA